MYANKINGCLAYGLKQRLAAAWPSDGCLAASRTAGTAIPTFSSCPLAVKKLALFSLRLAKRGFTNPQERAGGGAGVEREQVGCGEMDAAARCRLAKR